MRFDIAREDDRSQAADYLNFSRRNIDKIRKLSGDITFKDLNFIPLRGKKGLIASPSTIYMGKQLLSKLAADSIQQSMKNNNMRKGNRKRKLCIPSVEHQSNCASTQTRLNIVSGSRSGEDHEEIKYSISTTHIRSTPAKSKTRMKKNTNRNA